MANLVILTAGELLALGSLQRQADRRTAREQPLVRLILRTFLQRGGPISVDDIIAASRETRAAATHDGLAALDDEDIIRVRAGQIDVVYPFSAVPTPFRVRFSGGRERHACCATDALGMAPMVGEPVEINSSCHQCGAPLKFAVTPHGVEPGSESVMVWFGTRGDEACKAADSL